MSASTGGRGATGSAATSRSLIAGVRSNDAAAWERLVTLYAPFVFRQCQQAHLSRADAADVFQEVFHAAFARITSFEQQRPGSTFRGWLRVIARNKIHDHFRRLAREPRAVGGTEIRRHMAGVAAPEPSADTPSGRQPAEDELLQSALERIREQFHQRTWQAFLGTVVHGRSPADVGTDLGMSPGAVRVAKSRVLQRLRAELGDL